MARAAPGQDVPEDRNTLVEDINRTRAELGDTVEALVAKVDVKARAQQRAAEVSTQAKEKLQAVKQGLAGQASQLTGKAEQTRQAAAANGKTVLGAGASGGKTGARHRPGRGRPAHRACGHGRRRGLGSTPEPVQRGARRAARTVGGHRVPVAAATGAVLVAAALAGDPAAPRLASQRPGRSAGPAAEMRLCLVRPYRVGLLLQPPGKLRLALVQQAVAERVLARRGAPDAELPLRPRAMTAS